VPLNVLVLWGLPCPATCWWFEFFRETRPSFDEARWNLQPHSWSVSWAAARHITACCPNKQGQSRRASWAESCQAKPGQTAHLRRSLNIDSPFLTPGTRNLSFFPSSHKQSHYTCCGTSCRGHAPLVSGHHGPVTGFLKVVHLIVTRLLESCLFLCWGVL